MQVFRSNHCASYSVLITGLYCDFKSIWGLLIASLIHFMVMLKKWLKSAHSMVICGLFVLIYDTCDGIGAAGAKIYPGGLHYFSNTLA